MTQPQLREFLVDGSLVGVLATAWFAGYLHRRARPRGLSLPTVVSLATAIAVFFFAFLAFAMAE